MHRAKELGFTDSERLGLQRMSKTAWMVGASARDIAANLGSIKPKCRSALSDQNVNGEDLARTGVCEELVQPAGVPGRQRLLSGVFAKRLANPQKRLRQMRSDMHGKADAAGLEAERRRITADAQAAHIEATTKSVFTNIMQGDVSTALQTVGTETMGVLRSGTRTALAEGRTPVELATGAIAAIYGIGTLMGGRKTVQDVLTTMPEWIMSSRLTSLLHAAAAFGMNSMKQHAYAAMIAGAGTLLFYFYDDVKNVLQSVSSAAAEVFVRKTPPPGPPPAGPPPPEENNPLNIYSLDLERQLLTSQATPFKATTSYAW